MTSSTDEGAQHDELEGSAYRRFEAAIELPMILLAVTFAGLLIADQVRSDSHPVIDFGFAAIWVLFVVEVGVLFVLAPRKRTMLREHWLDVFIAAAPFLRPLRIARLLPLLQVGGTVGRSLRGVQRITANQGVQTYGAMSLVITASSGLLVWLFERNNPDALIDSPADGLWWAVVTVTTVGYGDFYPLGIGGRSVALALMLIGIGLVGIVTANIAAVIVTDDQDEELSEIKAQLDRIEATLARMSPDEESTTPRP